MIPPLDQLTPIRLVMFAVLIGCTRSIPTSARAPSSERMHLGRNDVDPTIDPCVDFYAYACGPWLGQHPIQADATMSTAFGEFEDRNDARLRALLDHAATKPGDALERRVGDYWAARLDVPAIDTRALEPLQPEGAPSIELRDSSCLARTADKIRREDNE